MLVQIESLDLALFVLVSRAKQRELFCRLLVKLFDFPLVFKVAARLLHHYVNANVLPVCLAFSLTLGVLSILLASGTATVAKHGQL